MKKPKIEAAEKVAPVFSPGLFWDVDPSKIRWGLKWQWVIERVMERGNPSDWRELKRFYGLEKIRTAMLNARYLNKKVLYYSSLMFDEPVEKFRCYDLMRSQRALWQL